MGEVSCHAKPASWRTGEGGLRWLSDRMVSYESLPVDIDVATRRFAWGGLLASLVGLVFMCFGSRLVSGNLDWCWVGGGWPQRALLRAVPAFVRFGAPSVAFVFGIATAVLTEGFWRAAPRLMLGSFVVAAVSYLVALPALVAILVVVVNAAIWVLVAVVGVVVGFVVLACLFTVLVE